MAQIQKPDSINKIWSSAGDISLPPEQKIREGWAVEIPPREWFNWLDNKQDLAIAHINQHGIAVWDEVTEYQGQKSYAQDPSTGVVYRCLVTNTGNIPSNSPTFWKKAFLDDDDPLVVNAVPRTRRINTGTGLSGGGDLSADRTLSVNFGTTAGTVTQGNDSRLSNAREWTADTVTQAEAEAGTATTRRAWTAQRVRQAIVAWFNGATTAFTRTILGRSNAAQVRSDLQLGTAATREVAGVEEWQDPSKLMPSRSFGLGYSLITGSDRTVNDLHSSGFYSTRTGDAYLPTAVQANGSFLLSISYNDGGAHNGQMLMSRNSTDPRVWWRSRSSNEWSPWEEAVHTGNLLKMYGEDYGSYYPGTVPVNINNLSPGQDGLFSISNSGTFPALGGSFYWISTKRMYSGQAMFQEAVTYSATGAAAGRRAYRVRANDGTWGNWNEYFTSFNFDPSTKADKTVQIIAGTGLSGGGTLASSRTLSVNYGTSAGTAAQGNDPRLSDSREWSATTMSQAEAEAGTATTRRAITAQRLRQAIAAFAAPLTRRVNAGTGLTGGGDLSADRTISVNFGTAAGTVTQGNDSRLSNSREWTAETVSQTEAQAGTSTTRRAWTAQRVRQAIVAWFNSTIATTSQAQSLSSDNTIITPLKLDEAFKGANQRLTANGYQRLPGGLILQWGGTTSEGVNYAFPIAFPTACVSLVGTDLGSNNLIAFRNRDKDGFEMFSPESMNYIAIGY